MIVSFVWNVGFAGSFGVEGLDRISCAPAVGRGAEGGWRLDGCESNVIESQGDFGDNEAWIRPT